jgi:hypothetical protein
MYLRSEDPDAVKRAEEAFPRIDTRVRGTIAEGEYLDVSRRFRLARSSLLAAGAAVFAAAVVGLLALADTPTPLAAKDATAVNVLLTHEGTDAYERIAGIDCQLPGADPPGALVAGTLDRNPVVVLLNTGDPDCDGHRLHVTERYGRVVSYPADPLPESAAVPGTAVRVSLTNTGVEAFEREVGCGKLPAISGEYIYDGNVVSGIYGKHVMVVLNVPRSRCNGKEFTVVPDYGTAYPTAPVRESK